jgi:phosphoglycerol transferase MdoB-like AlkP superfamily enzyme
MPRILSRALAGLALIWGAPVPRLSIGLRIAFALSALEITGLFLSPKDWNSPARYMLEVSPVLAIGLAGAAVAILTTGLLLSLRLLLLLRSVKLRRFLAGLLLAVLPAFSVFNLVFLAVEGTFLSRQLVREGVSLLAHGGLGYELPVAEVVVAWLALVALFIWMTHGFDLPDRQSAGHRLSRETAFAAGAAGLISASCSFGIFIDPRAAAAAGSKAHAVTAHLPFFPLAAGVGAADLQAGVSRKDVFRHLRPRREIDEYLETLRRLPVKPKTNVVLVLLEGIPVDHVGFFGYRRNTTPELDRLARNGLAFDRAFSATNESKNAQTALLASVLPMRGDNNDFLKSPLLYPRVLCWDVFRALGYQTAVISTQDENWLGMRRFQLYEKQPPDIYLHAPDMSDGESYLGGFLNKDEATVNRRIFAFLEERRGDRHPFFLYTNFQRTHFAYPLPSGVSPRFGPIVPLGDRWRRWQADDFPNAVDVFDSALYYVDQQLGALVSRIDTLGLGDDTLIAVTADHGQGFEVGGFPAAESISERYVHVPMVLLLPGRLAPRHFRETVSTIDLFPTILGVLGVPPCPGWQGIDVRAAGEDFCRRRPIFVGDIVWKNLWLMMKGRQYVIVDTAQRRVVDADDASKASGGRDLLDLFLRTFLSHVLYYSDPELQTRFIYPEAPGAVGNEP